MEINQRTIPCSRRTLLVAVAASGVALLSDALAQPPTPPQDPESLLARAWEGVASGQYAETLALLEPAAPRYPESWRLPFCLGYASFHLRQYDRALQWLEAATERVDDDARILDFLARSYLAVGRPELAVRAANKALTMSPARPALRTTLGLAHVLANEPQAAIEVLESLPIVPSDTMGLFALATAYGLVSREGDFQRTLKQARALEDAAPKYRRWRSKEEWELSGLRRHEGEHITVLLPPGVTSRPVLRLLDLRYTRVARALGSDPPGRIEVALYSNEQTYRRIHGDSALAVDLQRARVSLPYSRVSSQGAGSVEVAGMVVLVAEAMAVGRLPFWLARGLRLAAVTYGKDTAYVYALRLKESRAVGIQALEVLPYDDMYASRTIPYFATKYLIETFGLRRLGDFLRAIGAGESAESALRSTYGLDYDGLTAVWQELAQETLDEHDRVRRETAEGHGEAGDTSVAPPVLQP